MVLDHNQRIGDNWRQQWDSLRLYSPAKFDGLPGMRFPADPWSFPTKDDVAAYLEAYAGRGTCRSGSASASRGSPGRRASLRRHHDAGPIHCDNVVVATGTFGRTPTIPDYATDLDPSILQLHSSEYRRPGQLREGPVLVVGASHSGTDIAYELAPTRPTTLVGRDCGQIPIRLESRLMPLVYPVLMFAWRHVLTRRTPMGRRRWRRSASTAGRCCGSSAPTSPSAGWSGTRRESRASATGSRSWPTARPPAANVIWATGFRQAFDWIDLPVVGADGWPREHRGVADDVPGLYFCGLSFQYSFSSMLLAGAGRDAEHVARHITQRRAKRTTVRTPHRDHQAA